MLKIKEGGLLSVVIAVATALTLWIVCENVRATLIPQPLQYRQRYQNIEERAVLKSIEEAGLAPVEARHYEVLK